MFSFSRLNIDSYILLYELTPFLISIQLLLKSGIFHSVHHFHSLQILLSVKFLNQRLRKPISQQKYTLIGHHPWFSYLSFVACGWSNLVSWWAFIVRVLTFPHFFSKHLRFWLPYPWIVFIFIPIRFRTTPLNLPSYSPLPEPSFNIC